MFEQTKKFASLKLQIDFKIYCKFYSQAVLNACEERSERGGGHPARSNPGQPRSNRPQSAASLAKARRGKIYGIVIALAVMVVFFTIIGVIFYHHHKKTGMIFAFETKNHLCWWNKLEGFLMLHKTMLREKTNKKKMFCFSTQDKWTFQEFLNKMVNCEL